MDSQNSFTPGEGFVNLLGSQLSSDIYSPCIDLGSSDVPLFSTQGSDDPSDIAMKRKLWSPKEDLVLISAWLNTSKDPVVGNEQKAAAQKGKTSGQNENDVMKLAHDIFFNDYDIKFALEHAWRELRFDQKWCTTSSVKDGASAKKRRVDDLDQSSTSMAGSVNEDQFEARPPGVKASKANAKKAGGVKAETKDMKEFSSMWDMKQRNLEMKDKIRDKRILESLLAKTEALTEIEIALKNKLISAMYGL
ncbi:glutathione S-transferase T3-like [Eutrema salsugineum]|uniref:glutathione S-transferase T3-like n=1 Tax=Eutrema salsugineum TaxID=72664 RepID=UPI000CED7F93|nr:glutathione S-transferase T3-like [Eutrema salsugineum]